MIEDFLFNSLDWVMKFIFLPLVLILVLAIPVVIWSAYQDSKKPNFELKKDEWDCGRVHNYTTTTFIMVGKVMLPQVTHHTDCLQWNKK